MAFPNFFLIILLLLPSSQVLSDVQPNLNTQPLLMQACEGIDDRDLCLSNIRTHLQNLEPHAPSSVLHAALRTTLNEARQAIETMTRFTGLSVSYREQIAIEDCKELLDFSVSELAWSLTEMRKIRDGDTRAEYEGNLKAWLSAALSNQDTCLEGFEGTDRHLESFIRGSLKQVTQLIGNVLAMYTQLHTLPFRPPRNSTSTYTSSKFPEWITDGDQELLRNHSSRMHADAVVSLDGSGRYQTITDAINEAPSYNNRRYVIYVKKGVYKENIDMKKKKTNIMLVGDGIGQTVVTADRNFMQGWTTFRTATVAVSGKGFIARDITFRNTAGPENHQAVALRVDSDQSAFFRCSIEGYQDTLYVHSLRQFYRECNIYGTIDFIFGNGAAVLQNCKIFTRVPLPLQKVTVTAQGRKSPNQNTGFSIQNSYILATQPTYLGRPWKPYSRTVFMNTYMGGMVQPRGWLEWYGDFALNTLWYGEYRNYGPGSSLSGRVKWPGYHIIRDAATANSFTVGRFLNGRSYFYMVSAWGGYVFIINLIPLYVLVLLITGRYSMRLYVAYNCLYILGMLLAMQIRFVGFQHVQSGEHMAAMGVFFLMQVFYFLDWVKHMLSDTKLFQEFLRITVTCAVAVGGIALGVGMASGYISPWTGRFYSLLDPTYAKDHIPIIASVSEHQPTAWSSFMFDFHILLFLFPAGLYFCFKRLSDATIFIVMYGLTSMYFAGVMVRLILVATPAVCLISAIAVSATVKNLTVLLRSKTKVAQIGSTKGTSSAKASSKASLDQSQPFQKNGAMALLFGAFYLLSRYATHCTWVTSEAYSSPSIVLAARGAHGNRVIFDDYREAYFWLRQNTPLDAKVMSWWDYGYQITAMGNRTVIVDNNTWNNTHIATVGRAMSSYEDEAYEIIRSLDVDYVLVVFGGVTGYSSDDINKFLWMVRIGGGVFPVIKEPDYLVNGEYRVDKGAAPKMLNCLMYKLSYYRFGEMMTEYGKPPGYDRARGVEIGNKDIKLEHLEEAFTTSNWIVRIYKVKPPNNRW